MLKYILRFFLQKKGHGLFGVERTEKDYQFGDGQLEALGAEVIRADGQWGDFLPPLEIQKFPFGDTFHCTVYGTENCMQTLMKAKYGVWEEYTERFLGVLAGIQNNKGGSPIQVIEKWRTNGNLFYRFLPFDGIETFEDYNSPKPMTPELLAEAAKWLTAWRVGYDWVNPTIDSMKEALKYSPLGVGVYAWPAPKNGLYYKPSWATDNHWIMLYGYVEGQYWLVYDHYEDSHKKLDWNYPFKFVERYSLIRLAAQSDEAVNANKGFDIYKRMINKHLLVKPSGEVWYLTRDTLTYEGWWTNSKWMQSKLDEGLRNAERKGEFSGILQEDFDALKTYVLAAGIKVDDTGIGTINQLKSK